MSPRLTAISRKVSYALRHRPQEFGLVLDAQGFVAVDDLLAALNAQDTHLNVTRADLEEIISTSPKQRHEIAGDRIRALYGHSGSQHMQAQPACPPDVLYHGTSHAAAATILQEGLKPMGRQYVHLSADVTTAHAVGVRHDASPVLLVVDAAAAHAAGVAFYRGNDQVWLADAVPARYISQTDWCVEG